MSVEVDDMYLRQFESRTRLVSALSVGGYKNSTVT